jgi:MtN3 and saliva related transmembrane protein
MIPLDAMKVEEIGFVAAFLTTVAFVPQLLRVLKLKSAREISLGTFLMYSLGVFLWLVYGLYIGSKPVIASNATALVLSLAILALKVKYDLAGSKKELEG